MADEALWFEPVSLLPRCSLSEALLWVWAERVPLYNMEREEHAVSTLQDWECEHLNIPPVPEGTSQAAHYRTEDRLRKKLNSYGRKMPKDSLEYHVSRDMEAGEAVRKWLPLLTIAMELPAAELFLKLRRGQIETMGKILPAGAEIIDFVEQYKSYGRSDFDDLVDSPIPQDYWTMPGIDWLSNALTARGKHYCDVSISVEVLMRLFPGEREPVIGAQFVGNCILVKESTEGSIRPLPKKARGRPPTFAWEEFHVEVADLIRSGQMPRKKKAAIQHMVGWFASTQTGEAPSRSTVSEKLTPYYRRFFLDRNENAIEPS